MAPDQKIVEILAVILEGFFGIIGLSIQIVAVQISERLESHAIKLGTDAGYGSSAAVNVLDWELDTVNGGIRYALHLFGRGNLSWLGGGVSSIRLDRIVRTTRVEQDGPFSHKEVREETRDRFRSTSFYVEMGQLVQSFFFEAQPRVGFFWNAKWDYGQHAAESTGGLSLQAGILIGL